MKDKSYYLSLIREYEIIIASSAVILLVVFLVFNMLLPNLNQANQIYVQGQTLRHKVDALKQKNSLLSSLDYQYYKDIFVKSNQVLPEGKDYVSLIWTFDSLEKKSAVTILRTDFQLGVVSTSSANLVGAAGTSAFVIPINIEILGTKEKVQEFLEAVDSYAGRLMVFDSMSVTTKQGEILDAVFTGQSFFYPLPTTLQSIDSKLPKLEKNQDEIIKKINNLTLSSETAVEIDQNTVGKKNLFE